MCWNKIVCSVRVACKGSVRDREKGEQAKRKLKTS